MGKKASSVTVIAGRGSDSSIEHSISTRKISNGYIVRQSSYNGNTGECSSSESFTKSPPRVVPPKLDGRQESGEGNSLKDAKDYLGS